jgi:kynurenine formamidase
VPNKIVLRLLVAAGVVGLCIAVAQFALRHREHDSQVMAVNPAAIRTPVNVEEFDVMFDRIRNWGRWGADDQLGAANFITDAKRREAVALVRLGRTVSLSHSLLSVTSPEATPATFEGNGTPFEHTMDGDLTTDTYKVTYHSFLHSHLDALCHFSYKGKDFNGAPTASTNTRGGCTRLGVENLRNGLVTRGILIDIPRLRNVEYLEPGTPVFIEDIEAWEKMAGVTVGPGDAIFLRTGRWAMWKKLGPSNLNQKEAGFHPSIAPWLKERGVAIIGSDAGLDVLPSPVIGVPDMPLHVLAINALGIVVLDNHDLEEVASVAAALGQWQFMVTVAPLVVPGGTGSPVNTIAMF